MSPEIIGSLIGFILFVIPFGKMLDRTGLPKAWLLVLLIPVFGVFILWLVLALSKWRATYQGGANGP